MKHFNIHEIFGKTVIAICMLIPIVMMGLIMMKPDLLAGNRDWLFVLFLLCPLSHFLMLRHMQRSEQEQGFGQPSDHGEHRNRSN